MANKEEGFKVDFAVSEVSREDKSFKTLYSGLSGMEELRDDKLSFCSNNWYDEPAKMSKHSTDNTAMVKN